MNMAWKSRSLPLRFFLMFALLIVLMMLSTTLVSAQESRGARVVGPKQHYVALGDSLAFGLQPDQDFANGYADQLAQRLVPKGMTNYANLGCPGETSASLISGECPFPQLRKFPYEGSQLAAAINYITLNAGNVSPVTLSIGANDVLGFIDVATCQVNDAAYQGALNNLKANLRQVILPGIKGALTVNGKVTGDILVTNLYNPFQNVCPNTVPYVKQLNTYLAASVKGYGKIVNVFGAYGGAQVPNAKVCAYTWICSEAQDIHPNDTGYKVITDAILREWYC